MTTIDEIISLFTNINISDDMVDMDWHPITLKDNNKMDWENIQDGEFAIFVDLDKRWY